MAKTWLVKYYFERGGNSANASWTNTLAINTGAPLNGDFLGLDDMKEHVTQTADALALALLSDARIYKAVITDPLRKGNGYDYRYVRTIPFNIAGEKLIGAAAPEIKEVVIRLQKAGATGKSGRLELRMLALDSEVTGGSTGDPFAAGPPAGVESMITALNAQNGQDMFYHVYNKSKKGIIRDTPIEAFVYRGVGTRDAHTHRKKKVSVTDEASFGKGVFNVAGDLINIGAQAAINRAKFTSPAALVLLTALEAALPLVRALPAAAETVYKALPGGD